MYIQNIIWHFVVRAWLEIKQIFWDFHISSRWHTLWHFAHETFSHRLIHRLRQWNMISLTDDSFEYLWMLFHNVPQAQLIQAMTLKDRIEFVVLGKGRYRQCTAQPCSSAARYLYVPEWSFHGCLPSDTRKALTFPKTRDCSFSASLSLWWRRCALLRGWNALRSWLGIFQGDSRLLKWQFWWTVFVFPWSLTAVQEEGEVSRVPVYVFMLIITNLALGKGTVGRCVSQAKLKNMPWRQSYHLTNRESLWHN